jgi:LmbE family N-acetylglucosaminyl deacetylase
MATLVCLHAHPDDESIATAGVMAKAAEEGHTAVLVFATKGEVGEVDDGVLEDGEDLAQRRVVESEESAKILGAEGVHFLGYRDSGMAGEPTNNDPACFWQANIDEASDRLAAILTTVGCDVLTIYDENGNYGHPDHVQVHRVGAVAATKAKVGRVFEATVNRDYLQRLWAQAQEQGAELPNPGDDDAPPDFESLGVPEAQITHGVDVRRWIDRKRASMRAHASQIGEQSFFLQMPEDAFREAFGVEWFIEHGQTRAPGEPIADRII